MLAGLLLVTGCAAGPAPTVSVALEQSRDNENRHLLQVAVTNQGGQPVQLVRLQLRSPRFVPVAPTVREDVLAPGDRLVLPVTYGAADCRGRGPAEVVVGHRVDGVLREHDVPVPADDPLLPRLHERECRLAELARSASLSFAPGWTRRGDSAAGTLVLTRLRGSTPMAVTAVDGSVIFTLQPTGPLPAVLDEQVRLPVAATPSRCDPHALAESRRTYDFTLALRFGDGPPLTVAVRPGAADLPLLEQLVRDVCR